MDAHTRAILAKMTPEERAFYERGPARSWLAQMRKQLSTMDVSTGALSLRENMVAFRRAKPAKTPTRSASGKSEGVSSPPKPGDIPSAPKADGASVSSLTSTTPTRDR